MIYMPPAFLKDLKAFAKKAKMTYSQVVREGVAMRTAEGDPYNNGFNDGLACAIDTANNNETLQMRFPNGKTFADCLADDLQQFKR